VNKFKFEIDEYHNIILVDAIFDGYSLRLLLDTGASNTVIDLSTMIVNGYNTTDSIKDVEIETAKGVTSAKVYKIKELKSLNIIRSDYEVTAYDFISNGIIAEFDGVLGLDFFYGKKICVDFVYFEISVG
jgi:hypothetical protein